MKFFSSAGALALFCATAKAQEAERTTSTESQLAVESSPNLSPPINHSTGEEPGSFKHFIAHSDTQTCTSDEHATPFNNQIRGVSLGGWMVLEPWITPSMFYQFLGQDETSTATDIYSFCKVLGKEEGNKQLRRHWKTWVTEEIIVKLKESGAVNSLRLPVGDWMVSNDDYFLSLQLFWNTIANSLFCCILSCCV
jgi:glucan 1,3-beta-glucosidase